MTIEYCYVRDMIYDDSDDGHWDIDNPARVDAEGNQIYLCKEVESLFPGKHFISYCHCDCADFVFDEELTPEEKELLDTLVYNHKNNL